MPVVYGHEPLRGYSNARNKSIDLALTTDAQVLVCIDDDMLFDPDCVLGHLRSLRELDCDVASSAFRGSSLQQKQRQKPFRQWQ